MTTSTPRKAGISASEYVVRDILRGLYEQEFVPGQRLIETDLIDRYGVSRATVREAIKLLEVQGVVEIHHNRGARIRQLSKREARNILLITERIVGLAARLAADNIDSPGARQDITQALEGLLHASDQSNRYDFLRQRNNFHRTLTRIAGSAELGNMLSNLQLHLVRNRLVMSREDRASSYRRIVDAVLAGDADRAEEEARRHVCTMIELLDKLELERSTTAQDW